MSERKMRTGSMRGGSQGTRVHPDSAEDQQDRRVKALQRTYGDVDVETGRATVERGRTIECAVEIDKSLSIEEQVNRGQKRFVGYDKEGRSIYGPVYTYFGPGQEVVLPISEIARLKELGFLVDPRKTIKTQQDTSRSQSHPSNEPRATVFNRGEQHLPGPIISR